MAHGDGLCSHRGGRACDVSHTDCPWARYRGAAAPAMAVESTVEYAA
jgi:ferrochelatase